jgi:hypothetical protein
MDEIFLDAIKVSIAKASLKEQEETQITETINALSAAIKKGVGSVELFVSAYQNSFEKLINSYSKVINQLDIQSAKYLFLQSTSNTAFKELVAILRQDGIGYPINIEYSSKTATCSNLNELRTVFLDLLDDMNFQIKLKQIMKKNQE